MVLNLMIIYSVKIEDKQIKLLFLLAVLGAGGSYTHRLYENFEAKVDQCKIQNNWENDSFHM